MRIACKFCHYEYEYERYGAGCPQCGTENQPFRSSAARQAMGLEEMGSRYFSEERREEAARAGDPMYGKSALRRLRPYFALLILAFAVVALGQGLMRLSRQAQPDVSQGIPPGAGRPPILELADDAYNLAFAPAGGWQLRVNAAGWLKNQPPAARQWLFIDFLLLVDDRAQTKDNPFVPPVAAAGETVALPEPLPGQEWDGLYTPLDLSALEIDAGVSGQLFYHLPAEIRQVTLFYEQAGERQSLILELSAPKN